MKGQIAWLQSGVAGLKAENSELKTQRLINVLPVCKNSKKIFVINN